MFSLFFVETIELLSIFTHFGTKNCTVSGEKCRTFRSIFRFAIFGGECGRVLRWCWNGTLIVREWYYNGITMVLLWYYSCSAVDGAGSTFVFRKKLTRLEKVRQKVWQSRKKVLTLQAELDGSGEPDALG